MPPEAGYPAIKLHAWGDVRRDAEFGSSPHSDGHIGS
jgi:hypothetical protein